MEPVAVQVASSEKPRLASRLVAITAATLLVTITIAAVASSNAGQTSTAAATTTTSTQLFSVEKQMDKAQADTPTEEPLIQPITLTRDLNGEEDPESYPVPALCADGTPYRFYFYPGSGSGANNWVMFMQGGPECYSEETCVDASSGGCAGSAAYMNCTTDCYCNTPIYAKCSWGGPCTESGWENTIAVSDQQVLSNNEARNPAMSNWNKIYLPYCTKDMWSGQGSKWGINFGGHSIMKAVVAWMPNKESAGTVVLSGVSGGGLGVYLHANWLDDQFPSSTKVKILPIAGFFGITYNYEGFGAALANESLANFNHSETADLVDIWSSYLPEECAAAYSEYDEQYLCFLANFSAYFLRVPQFVLQAQSDCVQMLSNDRFQKPAALVDYMNSKGIPAGAANVINTLPTVVRESLNELTKVQYLAQPDTRTFLEQWKENQTMGMMPTINATRGDGLFNPACFIHGNFGDGLPAINGQPFYTTFAQWLQDEKSIVQRDDCGLLCGDCSLCLWAQGN